MPNEGRIPKESFKRVDAVDKALRLLETFLNGSSELSLKELSEQTGLYKSRILRLCGTLSAHGYLIRQPNAAYRLGPKLLVLGNRYNQTNSLASVARPVLKELSTVTGESSKLFVIDGTRRLCLVREKGTHPLRYAISEGESLELYAGAGGKVLLAFADMEFRDRVLGRGPLEKLTAATTTDRQALEREFDDIRRQGYAVSKGELVAEVAGLAAPVFDCDKNVLAAMTLAGPIQRFTDDRCRRMLGHLLQAARQLSQLMGCIDEPARRLTD